MNLTQQSMYVLMHRVTELLSKRESYVDAAQRCESLALSHRNGIAQIDAELNALKTDLPGEAFAQACNEYEQRENARSVPI